MLAPPPPSELVSATVGNDDGAFDDADADGRRARVLRASYSVKQGKSTAAAVKARAVSAEAAKLERTLTQQIKVWAAVAVSGRVDVC